jgi:predicted PurR-regulated permease PerM
MARFVSFLVLVAILVVLAVVFFQVMSGFLVPLFLAAMLGVVVQPLYRWAYARVQGFHYDRYIAAGVTTALVALIVLLPIGLIASTAVLEGLSLVDQLQLANVRDKLDELRLEFGLRIPHESDLRTIEARLGNWRDKQLQGESLEIKPAEVQNLVDRVQRIADWLSEQDELGVPLAADPTALLAHLTALHKSEAGSIEADEALHAAVAEFRDFKRNLLGGAYKAWIAEWANPSEDQVEQLRRSVLSRAGPVLSLGGGTLVLLVKLAAGLLIMIAALFFLLAEGGRMLNSVIKISPLEEQYIRELVAEFDRACRAIVSATLLSALAQGILAGIGFYVCGLRSSVALLMLLTMVLALVPFTGAAAVWVPVSLYLYFYQGATWHALGLAVYGTVIISGADNVIKPLVLHGQSNLHPLLALLSVIGGIQALGPIGILVGPMVVVFLQVLLRLVQREMSQMDRSSWTFWRGFGGAEPAPAAAGGAQAVVPAAENLPATTPAPAATVPPAASTPPPAAGNGKNSPGQPGKQPQHHGKKRRK